MSLTKKYAVDFTAIAAGDGYWGMDEGTEVTFHSIVMRMFAEEDGTVQVGELCAYHNKDAFDHGLCYTDKGIESTVSAFALAQPELSEIIAGGICGSEQGMQGPLMFSCDVDLHDGLTVDKLKSMGYTE